MNDTQTLPNPPPAPDTCQAGAPELALPLVVGCSSLAACANKLGRAYTRRILFTERTKAQGPFTNYGDYKSRGLTKTQRNFHVLALSELPTKIFVAGAYLKRLEVERQRRLRAAITCDDSSTQTGDSSFPDANASKATSSPAPNAEQASVPNSAQESPLARRILPEEVAPLLSSLPNPAYFKRVFLLDTPNWEDDWVRQNYSQTFSSAMAVARNGDVFLFQTEHNQYLRGDVFHEWTHLLSYRFDREYRVFCDALELEWRLWVPRTYALRSYGEHWAVWGEEMLAEDGARFLTAAQNGPVRSVIWMSALLKSLNSVEQEYRSPLSEKLMERCKFVFSCITLKALEALKQYQSSEDRVAKGRTRRLFKFIQEAQLMAGILE